MRSDSPGRWWAHPTSRAGRSRRWSCGRAISSSSTPTVSPRPAGQSDRFGDHRLRASLSAVSNPTQTVSRIESALDAFAVGPPQDDAAMLVLLRPQTALPETPSGSRAAGRGVDRQRPGWVWARRGRVVG